MMNKRALLRIAFLSVCRFRWHITIIGVAIDVRTCLPMMLTLLPLQLHLVETMLPKLSMTSDIHLGVLHILASLQCHQFAHDIQQQRPV